MPPRQRHRRKAKSYTKGAIRLRIKKRKDKEDRLRICTCQLTACVSWRYTALRICIPCMRRLGFYNKIIFESIEEEYTYRRWTVDHRFITISSADTHKEREKL